MEKSYEMKKTKNTEVTTKTNETVEVKKTFQITQDVIEECLETCFG
ncbi:hypothetical protein [Clostridium ganghwense]|uniref:Transposase n=1 Tax=Clostridium ganghwense TaxID=312089 RepID=A0ABT4CRC2_9CLOT|nr:hypothetical protein [Clostridium ganghwense]MCY6371614.1 hypothetical protein [Clostridium ganghwense]